ncbi:hypothetical protein ACM64Y_01750 [Novispirillum sp. DQ9]|uniref:hypothetical protein n=1 Tax=Novispirillum sp. DQ9 TaxID=3398612 RepID=UPI003C7C4027
MIAFESVLLSLGITNDRELLHAVIFLCGYAAGLGAWGLSVILDRGERGGR